MKIHKILIANRGEIALRIIRACKSLGIASVAVYSDADQHALFVQQADEAVAIGPAPASESYLNGAAIIAAAQRTGADAIHPGYGFLSENVTFARLCEAVGITFIGPPLEAMAQMSDKVAARVCAQQYGVPVIPGYDGEEQADSHLVAVVESIGFPLMIKAAAGGGGKGMRRVNRPMTFIDDLAAAKREALAAFGDDRVFLEKYLEPVRHIEIQVIADQYGQVVHAFERECSIQRRYQKMIEESPAPRLSSELREQMTQAAVDLATGIGYTGLGTVEFAVTPDEQFYFLEMNTRLQVEHPVTEAVTGLDLVQWQIQLAEGQPLTLEQSDITLRGHALECRVYAEDPDRQFMPMAGSLLRFTPPDGPGLRCDTGVESDTEISMYYDPLLAKIIAHGPDRSMAIHRMQRALQHTVVLGIPTNITLLQRVLGHEMFLSGHLETHFVHRQNLLESKPLTPAQQNELALVATLSQWLDLPPRPPAFASIPAGWRNNADYSLPLVWLLGTLTVQVSCVHQGQQQYRCQIGTTSFKAEILPAPPGSLTVVMNSLRRTYQVISTESQVFIHHPEWGQQILAPLPPGGTRQQQTHAGTYTMPMTGKIQQVLVSHGQLVQAGESLLILESMKMETTLVAQSAGVVASVAVQTGEVVQAGKTLLVIQAEANV